MQFDLPNPSNYSLSESMIPQDALNEALARALDESATAWLSKQHGEWKPGVYERPRWYVRLWRGIDRYLPRVSVHIGPHPEHFCDD